MIATFLFAAAVVPTGQSFGCTPTRVWRGDGPIWCAEGPRIRLSGVAAREIEGSCKTDHPCPNARPETARDALVQLIGRRTGTSSEGHVFVRGPTMTCRSDGSAGGGRTAAFCVSPHSGDVSCNMVAGGWAAKWQRYWRGHRCA